MSPCPFRPSMLTTGLLRPFLLLIPVTGGPQLLVTVLGWLTPPRTARMTSLVCLLPSCPVHTAACGVFPTGRWVRTVGPPPSPAWLRGAPSGEGQTLGWSALWAPAAPSCPPRALPEGGPLMTRPQGASLPGRYGTLQCPCPPGADIPWGRRRDGHLVMEPGQAGSSPRCRLHRTKASGSRLRVGPWEVRGRLERELVTRAWGS